MSTGTPWRAAVATLLLLPALVAVATLAISGNLAPPPEAGLAQPGQWTYVALPVSKALRDLGAATTAGLLALCAVALPWPSADQAARGARTSVRVMGLAAVVGSIWTWSSLAFLLLTYSDFAGVDLRQPGSLQYLPSFLGSVDLGQALLVSTALAASTTLGCLRLGSASSAGFLTVLSLAALWPLANVGHAAGSSNHDVAVSALMVHLLGISLWVGGLLALILLCVTVPQLDRETLVRRFSRIAGWAAFMVFVSGAVVAVVRLRSWSDLGSQYGILVVVKLAAFALLATAGWWQRRQLNQRFLAATSRLPLMRVAVPEVLLMALTLGVGVALSRTPPPGGAEAATAAEALLGHGMPPPLTPLSLLTQWRIDALWFPLGALALLGYGRAVRQLRRRGDSWAWGRTAAWVIGTLLLIWSTSGAPAAYGRVMFSMHMLQHMLLAIAVPTFLVLGAPATLAMRVLPRRRDGSRGPREWMLVVLHSRLVGFFSHVAVAAAVWIISLVAFYTSPLFEMSLRSHTMHQLMVFHFLLSGYLLASSICGVDPGPKRVPHPFRVIVLMMSFGAHALFSVSLMSLNHVLAPDWFTALDRPWGPSLLRDQYVGAQLGWLAGDYPIAVLGGALIWSWVRSDQREARRLDRKADRDGDRELRSYNEYLRALEEHSRRSGAG